MKLTPSQVKNLMRRGLRLLIDPDPRTEERRQVYTFFEYHCAYCDIPIEEGKGDLDHLLSAAKGGRNHISNRVLACKACNAKEKREKDWKEFLLKMCGGGLTFEQRQRKILDWIKSVGDVPPLSDTSQKLLEEQYHMVTAAYDEACRKVRGS
jgi:hypothetical protein